MPRPDSVAQALEIWQQSGSMLIATIPPANNFWNHGELHRLTDVALQAVSVLQAGV